MSIIDFKSGSQIFSERRMAAEEVPRIVMYMSHYSLTSQMPGFWFSLAHCLHWVQTPCSVICHRRPLQLLHLPFFSTTFIGWYALSILCLYQTCEYCSFNDYIFIGGRYRMIGIMVPNVFLLNYIYVYIYIYIYIYISVIILIFMFIFISTCILL